MRDNGRSNGVMAGNANQSTNSEPKALANYMGSRDGELQPLPQPHFRRGHKSQ